MDDLTREYQLGDFEQIRKWFVDRHMAPPPRDLLSKTGFIWPEVAAGFLYFTNSSICIVDGYIANPYSNKSIRNYALDSITMRILLLAKDAGFSIIKGDTQHPAIVAQFKKFQFHETGMFHSYSRGV